MNHLSYSTSVKLAKFLGKSVLRPINSEWYMWHESTRKDYTGPGTLVDYSSTIPGMLYAPAYTLEDILSRPFCGAFIQQTDIKVLRYVPDELYQMMAIRYFDGGFPAVEREIVRLMENK